MKIKEFYEKNEGKIKLIFLGISFVTLAISLFLKWNNKLDLLPFDLSWVAIILCGLPIIIEALIGVIKDHDITADVLVSLALIGSLILKEFFAAGEVAFIMQIGSLLEDMTSEKAKKGISKLIKLTPKKANLILGNEIKEVDADTIRKDDLIQVKAGESIPVDGIIIKGQTSVDQSAMTGESIPVEKKEGDLLMSGTLNQSGAIVIKATETAENSSLQRMVKLAESCDAQKAKIVRKANVWAAWLVVVSLSTAVIAGTIIGLIHKDFWLGFTRAVTVLVVFCPCAFVLATPTAISAGIGNASRHGVIVQSGEALERIAASNIAVFDKTGTLTKGEPSVKECECYLEFSEEEILHIAASGEALSSHPLAKAILKYNKLPLYEVTNHQTIQGKGLEFNIGEDKYYVGKGLGNEEETATIVYVYKNEEKIGKITIEDQIKDNASEIIKKLKEMKVKTVMLTGDNEKSAKEVCDTLGIDTYISNCSPEDKMNFIKEEEKKGNKVAMFGDGVNDSLALRSAYAGIAMGGIGSDAAIESAEAVIIHDNLDVIPYLFKISRKTQKRIVVNLCIAMGLNIIAVVLSIAGILNTVWGALFHNCGSVAIVLSAFTLLFYKDKK